MVALYYGSFPMFKTKYRIVESNGRYRPEERLWWWPFWFTFMHTYRSLDEAEIFLKIYLSYKGGKVVKEFF